MIRYRADWVVPISQAPIRLGSVTVGDGRIVACGPREAPPPPGEVQDVDLGHVAILPGLVNAHTHLELSHLHEAVPPATEFTSWIRGVIADRRTRPDPWSPETLEGIRHGIAECIRCGTALVGDISNTLVTVDRLGASSLGGVVFYELIRFSPSDPAAVVAEALGAIDALPIGPDVRVSLAAHAPYSVAPSLFREIRQATSARSAPCSVHLAESPSEVEFIKRAGGPWRTLLEELGTWDPAFEPPGVSPVAYLDRLGFLDARTLAVHGVQMGDEDLARLRALGATLVTCPRSNQHTGAGIPPVDRFYASGVAVAIGTDSLASAPDLSIFSELAVLRGLAPGVPASALLESATRAGARALGFDDEFGTIDAGKKDRLIAVTIPDGLTDVEEYLVSGVSAGDITWLE